MAYDRSVKMFDEPYAPVELEKAVAEKTINKGKFLSRAHADSYLCQMRTLKALEGVKSILEIGPGEGFAARNLRELGYEYDTLDFEGAHEPTIRADFRALDPETVSRRYDVVCAFQVLEHFPYQEFPAHLARLRALSTQYVFISLPYSCRGFSVRLNLQNGQSKRKNRRFDFYRGTNLPNRSYRPEFVKEFPWAVHYWEIGRKGFKLRRVLRDIEACGLKIQARFHAANPFHYHILCEKRGSGPG